MDINKAYIYRIFHIDNLEYILQLGKLTNVNNEHADPHYVGIGERELIKLRSLHEIITSFTNNSYCPSRDYLPFYFAPRSVMLYRIQTGFEVRKIEPQQIVHVVYKLTDIINNIEYLFTDGHGYAKMSQWFDDIQYLDLLDEATISANNWRDTEEDTDRQRRKQAEFWIRKEISLEGITGIAVYDEEAKQYADSLCIKYNRDIAVKVKKNYYY